MEQYDVCDPVVCNFCFPRMGIAVPMKAGDFLVINAVEYHCVLLRCYSDMHVFCLSSYLKTVVVGGNNNKRKLSKREEAGLRASDDVLGKGKKKKNKKILTHGIYKLNLHMVLHMVSTHDSYTWSYT